MSILDRIAATPEALMERAVGDARTVLDVGCGTNSPLGRFRRRFERTVGVDLFPPSAESGVHDEYRVMDVMRLEDEFEPRSFDAVVAFDVIEHLDEADVLRLLAMMERIARRRVVVHTPNGFLPQEEYEGNPLQVHRSGWTAERMRELGYSVRGSNGLRWLRGAEGRTRWRPARFWGVLARLTQPFVERRPSLAYQLLCVTELDRPGIESTRSYAAAMRSAAASTEYDRTSSSS